MKGEEANAYLAPESNVDSTPLTCEIGSRAKQQIGLSLNPNFCGNCHQSHRRTQSDIKFPTS